MTVIWIEKDLVIDMLIKKSFGYFCMFLIGASRVYSDGTDIDLWEACQTTESCKIKYHHLANQNTDPFLFLGETVDKEHPLWRKFRKSLRQYPDVRDCLVEEEKEVETPNLLKIDWERVGTSENASVCVFRIAASLGEVERTRAWLAYHSFKVGSFSQRVSKSFSPPNENYPVYNVTASWSVGRYRELNPSWFAAITGYDLIYSYTIVLNFDRKQRIAGVGVGTRSKLN